MPLTICENPNPSIEEVAATLLGNIGAYLETKEYESEPRKMTPSRAAAIERTIFSDPLDTFKFFTDAESVVRQTKDQNWIITIKTMSRKNIDDKKYQWRSLRLDRMKLDTVLVNAGSKGKVRVFPNVAAS
jgi:hypothetical protein